MRVPGKEDSRRDQPGCLGQQVVVVLGTRVSQGEWDPASMGSQSSRELIAAFRGALRRRCKDLRRERKGDQAQPDLLRRHPVRAQVWRVGLAEGIESTPKKLGVALVERQVVGPAEREGPTETARLPGKLD